MTELVLVEAYKFEELGEKAKERVIYWLAEGMGSLWEDDQEYWLEQWAELGYEDIDFQYTGFYSQGDGASIACSVNVRNFILRSKLGNDYKSLLYWLKKLGVVQYVSVTRERWGHYVHDNLLRANADHMLSDFARFEDDEEYGAGVAKAMRQAEKILPLVLEEVREKSREVYKSLEIEYDYRMGEEYAADMCAANEYLFNEYGGCIHHMIVEPKQEEATA